MGTRLRPLSDDLPKALIPFHGRPFLDHVIELLADQGFERVLLLLGWRPELFEEMLGDGARWGVSIHYRVTPPEALTAHRVLEAMDTLDDNFLLLYCDNYWPMRFDRLWEQYQSGGAPCQVVVYANRDEYTRSSVVVGDGLVTRFDRDRLAPGLSGVEISYAIIDRSTALPLLEAQPEELFEVAVYQPLAERGQLGAYWSEHRYYSVGSMRRLPLTNRFLSRHPTVILDRDGVLNERPPRAEYVTHPRDFRWIDGSLEALRALNEAGWRTVVVSNQAGIARGHMTDSDLAEITGYMMYTAAQAGGRIDGFYACPHGWDEGCLCRKPRPGLLAQAQRDFDLDLTRTFFIGDDDRDLEAARSIDGRGALVSESCDLREAVDRLLAGQLKDETE
jgi:D-glycero-D-manno-heptose 1,7-bisphosphate phosphatase